MFETYLNRKLHQSTFIPTRKQKILDKKECIFHRSPHISTHFHYFCTVIQIRKKKYTKVCLKTHQNGVGPCVNVSISVYMIAISGAVKIHNWVIFQFSINVSYDAAI